MRSSRKNKLSLRELVIFGMLGAVMFASKEIMSILPNIHLLGTIIIAMTVVYRYKALYPLYTFVMITGLTAGFATWWIPYLYIWTVLWGVTMLLPHHLPKPWQIAVYSTACGLHGLLYGVLYAPSQALLYHMNWQSTLAWIVAGLPFDVIHGVSNFCVGLLTVPLIALLRRCEKAER